MRVTRTIKDYITRRVNEIYQPKINGIDADYRKEQDAIEEKIHSAVKRFDEELKAIVAENCKNYNFKAGGYSYSRTTDFLTVVGVRDKEAEDKFYNEKRKLTEEKNLKIEGIIVELELGGTKETLEKLLSEL